MRVVAVVALVQFCVLVLGWCGLAVVLRVHGYPEVSPLDPAWRPSAVWLRECGLWMLFVVPVWVSLAAWCHDLEWNNLRKATTAVVGVAILILALLAFMSAAVSPRLPRGLQLSPHTPPEPRHARRSNHHLVHRQAQPSRTNVPAAPIMAG